MCKSKHGLQRTRSVKRPPLCFPPSYERNGPIDRKAQRPTSPLKNTSGLASTPEDLIILYTSVDHGPPHHGHGMGTAARCRHRAPPPSLGDMGQKSIGPQIKWSDTKGIEKHRSTNLYLDFVVKKKNELNSTPKQKRESEINQDNNRLLNRKGYRGPV